MLEIKNLSFSYSASSGRVLQDVSLQLGGGVCGLLGANGVGKSTLLYLIAGLLTPDNGCVELDGKNTRLRHPSTLSEIFVVPEVFELPDLMLSQYIKMLSPFYPNFSIEDLHRNLTSFDLPTEMPLKALSMGMAKKVLMSIALAANTKVLLMDEPTNGLDIPSKAAFRSFIASQMNPDRIVVISTHQVQDINFLVDRVVILKGDNVVVNEPVSRILDKLSFNVSNDPTEIGEALIALPALEGTRIVERNIAGVETTLDLESFFSFATLKTDSVKEIFAEQDEVVNEETAEEAPAETAE